jgi:hypothetical protein
MATEQTIDLTRGNVGLWILFVCFAGLALAKRLRKTDFTGVRQAAGQILLALFIGALTAVPFVVLVEAWELWGPQYFVRLRLDADRVVLGYRWPKPERAVPIRDATNVSIIRDGRCSRIQILTGTESFRSFGLKVGQLNDQEQLVLTKLIDDVAARRAPLPSQLP